MSHTFRSKALCLYDRAPGGCILFLRNPPLCPTPLAGIVRDARYLIALIRAADSNVAPVAETKPKSSPGKQATNLNPALDKATTRNPTTKGRMDYVVPSNGSNGATPGASKEAEDTEPLGSGHGGQLDPAGKASLLSGSRGATNGSLEGGPYISLHALLFVLGDLYMKAPDNPLQKVLVTERARSFQNLLRVIPKVLLSSAI